MSNNKKRKKTGYYTLDSFPANYSGQYADKNFRPHDIHADHKESYEREEIVEGSIAPEYVEHPPAGDKHPHDGEHPHSGERPHSGEHHGGGGKGSIFDSLGGIFKRRDDGGGFLKNLFSGKNIKNIFTDLDFEDLILLGVMFFLLRDGAEDELLIILAVILFTGG